jgi:hypothetical protein
MITEFKVHQVEGAFCISLTLIKKRTLSSILAHYVHHALSLQHFDFDIYAFH